MEAIISHQSKNNGIMGDTSNNSSSRDNRITLVAAASFAVGVVAASVIFRQREKRRRKVSRLNGESSRECQVCDRGFMKIANPSFFGAKDLAPRQALLLLPREGRKSSQDSKEPRDL